MLSVCWYQEQSKPLLIDQEKMINATVVMYMLLDMKTFLTEHKPTICCMQSEKVWEKMCRKLYMLVTGHILFVEMFLSVVAQP